MDIFSNSKKIYRQDFDKALRQLPDISPKERDYLKSIFDKDLNDGLTEAELKERIRRLELDQKDEIDRFELKRVFEKLSHLFEK